MASIFLVTVGSCLIIPNILTRMFSWVISWVFITSNTFLLYGILIVKWVSLNFKKLRKRANLSQNELASLLGVNQYNISFWEIGRSEPNIEQIIQISEILKIPTDYLLGKNVILTSSIEEFQTVTNHFKQDIEDEMLNELISLYSSISNEKKKDLLQLVKSLTNLSK